MAETINSLVALSDAAAELVERTANSIVAVHGGGQWPSSGIHWRSGVIVTAEEVLERDEDIKVTLPGGRVVAASLAGRPAPRPENIRVTHKGFDHRTVLAKLDGFVVADSACSPFRGLPWWVNHLAFDAPKTKTAAEVLDTLELAGKVLLVLPSPSDSGAVEKSFRNIRGVRVAYARSLGVYEVIAADHVNPQDGAPFGRGGIALPAASVVGLVASHVSVDRCSPG